MLPITDVARTGAADDASVVSIPSAAVFLVVQHRSGPTVAGKLT